MDTEQQPILTTATHLYTILPVSEWPIAAEFVCETVSPSVAFPNNPERFSILAAVSRATGELDAILVVGQVLLVDHYAARRGSGVSYSKLHDLLRSQLADGTVYYTAVGDNVGGRLAADHASLTKHGLLMVSVVGEAASEEEGGREDAVDSGTRSGDRCGGELSLGEESLSSGQTERR